MLLVVGSDCLAPDAPNICPTLAELAPLIDFDRMWAEFDHIWAS